VGRIAGDAFEGFRVEYFVPHLARGRYRVDKDAWARRKVSLSPGERRRAAELLGRAEALSLRADTFHRVLVEALDSEKEWLSGGEDAALRVLSQREAGRRLGLSSSTVSRAVAGRSVETPWGRQIRLADLFPQKKRVLREILSENAEALAGLSDRAVQEWLLSRRQLRVPRRTVNYWRRKLER
jgi:DNA-directed RNA polymerase specialized sigma54-like protein